MFYEESRAPPSSTNVSHVPYVSFSWMGPLQLYIIYDTTTTTKVIFASSTGLELSWNPNAPFPIFQDNAANWDGAITVQVAALQLYQTLNGCSRGWPTLLPSRLRTEGNKQLGSSAGDPAMQADGHPWCSQLDTNSSFGTIIPLHSVH